MTIDSLNLIKKIKTYNMQKGTLGLILPQSDMPFTKDGVTPDVILTPMGLINRMTLAQIIELVLGKTAALRGSDADGTPFSDLDMKSIQDELESYGYNRNGTEYLYNGMFASKIKCEIFTGPLFMQRLKHLVMDKMHSRARGVKTVLVHQPPEGRVRDGGSNRSKKMYKSTLCFLNEAR